MHCECGCGLAAPIARQSDTAKGWVRGQPLRFRRGHRGKLDARPLESRWIIDDTGCWVWQTNLSDGYGYLSNVGGRRVRAHRYVYERMREPIPEGMTLDHLCRNRRCVNPDHLEIVTIRENTLRGDTITGINAAKTHCLRGHPLSGANLYERNGRRHCRACRAAQRSSR